ncbi:MAG: UDP-glucose/GDP-mannose dehydrogenase family protein, partial [Desulfuromonadaceae bacterium]|nr:UDP-glucose/GDP-mannose dehydrogenase family protein [Desulfuromonadaceae bacterium]
PFNRNHQRTIFMGIRDAEMTKYTANAMLATKISFMNEISNLCDLLGVDVENVRLGTGSDSRIGYSFIYPGCGYGGSCFPKDVKALLGMAREIGFDSKVLQAVEDRNELQRRLLFKKITSRFGADLSGHTIAVWGLSFKPGTDDLREASSRVLTESLIGAGATVRAYDPVAMDNVRREWPAEWFDKGRLILTVHQYEALKNADAMALVTEWKPFRIPDFEAMKRLMKQPVIFDGRNQYDPEAVKAAGFEYQGIGRR